MTDLNLFTMLSSYRPGAFASPFENYCTTSLAYFLQRGQRMLTALFASAAGTGTEPLARVEIQPRLGDAGIADLLLTFEGGRHVLVEVQVEPGTDGAALDSLREVTLAWEDRPSLIFLGLPGAPVPEGWTGLTWLEVVEALEDDPEPIAKQLTEFVLRDILGLGPVTLEEAVATNRLYALAGATLRRRYRDRVSYVNSASRPMNGRYRYIGTTFAIDDSEMQFWVGMVNEALPLTEHYHLMMASKHRPIAHLADHPRATGDWKWANWTNYGRVVRPVTAEAYEELLGRLEI